MHRGHKRQNSHVYLMHCLERSLNYYYYRQTDGRTNRLTASAGNKVMRVGSVIFCHPFIQNILQNYHSNCNAMHIIQWCLWSWRWLILNEKVAKCIAVFDPHDFSLQIVGRGEGRQASSKDLDMFESLVHGWLLYFLWSKCISYLICNRSNSSSVATTKVSFFHLCSDQ